MNSLSGLKIKETETFSKALKKLQKRFKNIQADCDTFIKSIQATENLGVSIGSGIYKARIANSDKKSGKSGGYRIFSYLQIVDNELYLMYIYDKSDIETVSEKQVDELFKKAALDR